MMDEMGISEDPQALALEAETEGDTASLIQQSIERLQVYIDDSTQITPETLSELMLMLEQALSSVGGEELDEGTMRDRVAKEVFGDPSPAPVAGMLNRKSSMKGGYS